MARRLVVEIVGDSRSIERAFARSSRSAKSFNRDMSSTFRGTVRGFRGAGASIAGFASVIGGAAITRGIFGAVQAASDLNEEINKSRVTFGRSSTAITNWSETTAEAIGLSQAASLEAAGNFGAMFKTIGLADQQAAGMSRRLVELGADMASFNNEDPSEMLDRLRSGLAGEAEPLRRFGVLLSEARVRQEAYRSGIARVGATLTEQQKVQARYNLILRDSRLQAGDFARTSNSLANQQRILRAHFGDLAAKLGKALLPAATKLVDKLNSWLGDEKNQERLVNDLTTAFEGLATAIEKTAAAIEWLDEHKGPSGRDLFNRFKELTVFGRIRDLDEARAQNVPLSALHPSQRFPGRTFPGPRPGGAGLITGRGGRGAGGGLTAAGRAEIRNRIFDVRIARQLDRLQDLGLRQQLKRLRAIAQEVREQLAVRKDAERRATLEDRLLGIYREQRSVQEQIAANIREANAALKERADAIKAAVLERLQARQTSVENQRALRDARERLRIARQLGTARGIRTARENLQSVQAQALLARIQAAPATLNRRGQFAIGNVVTININGVTDPEAVARRVDDILKRRKRRTTTQTRPTAAGQTA